VSGLIVLFLLALQVPAETQTSAWIATWRLDLTRSVFAPGTAGYIRATRRIESRGSGVRIIEEFVHPRGGVTHLEWTGAFDGREYRVHGVDSYVTYGYRQVDERILESVTRVDNVVASTSRETLSADGRMLTIDIAHAVGQGLRTTLVFVRVTRGHDRSGSAGPSPADVST
jgi:hypothetical protein